MSNFGNILKKGKRRFEIKNKKTQWGRCESCDERSQLFKYNDAKGTIWMLCEKCSETFIEEEE